MEKFPCHKVRRDFRSTCVLLLSTTGPCLKYNFLLRHTTHFRVSTTCFRLGTDWGQLRAGWPARQTLQCPGRNCQIIPCSGLASSGPIPALVECNEKKQLGAEQLGGFIRITLICYNSLIFLIIQFTFYIIL